MLGFAAQPTALARDMSIGQHGKSGFLIYKMMQERAYVHRNARPDDSAECMDILICSNPDLTRQIVSDFVATQS